MVHLAHQGGELGPAVGGADLGQLRLQGRRAQGVDPGLVHEGLVERRRLAALGGRRAAGEPGRLFLQDGVDLVAEQNIGMTTVDLTSSEVGAKIILTDKLVRQENESVFNIVGRQFGDAAARKKDQDIIALFAALNGGVALGATTKLLTMVNLAAVIAFAKANKFPEPIAISMHPNSLYSTVASAAVTPSATYPMPDGYAEDLLKRFYSFEVNGVQVFNSGNIPGNAGGVANDGVGAIFSKNALVCLNSKGFGVEEERDASLRAWELVATADYGAFELDDTYGAPMLYTLAAPATNN